MRTILTLFGLSVLIFSCHTEEAKKVGTLQCHIKCTDPSVKVKLPFSGSELQGMWMIKHRDNFTVHDTVSISGQQVLNIYPWEDYEIHIPAINANVIIGALTIATREIDDDCGTECANPVTDAAVYYNFQPQPHSVELTNKNEYTISF